MLCSLLTDDLLLRILEKLDDDSDRRIWRLVCKDFLRVDYIQRTSLRVLRAEFLPSLIAKYVNATRLDLSVCPRIDDRTVSFLMSRSYAVMWFGRLKEVVLVRTTGLRQAGLEMLIRACGNLESIDVSHCLEFGDRECTALALGGGLREVKMDKCLNVTDVGLVKVAVGCPKIEQLSLKWCLEITDMGIDLLVRKCAGLKSLDISYLQVTNESLRSISSLQKLEDLGMVKCPFVDDAGLEFLGKGCPLLQTVNISRCKSISTSGLNSLIGGHNRLTQLVAGYGVHELSPTFLTLLSNLKNLKSIRIDGARVCESYLQTICENGKSLTEVGLSKCKGVTDSGIIHLVSCCINLRIVDLTCCDNVTDAAVSAVANSCRNLTCLKLEACQLITLRSLQSIGSHSMLLKEIDLTDCCGVNDKGLSYLSKCSELGSLKLGLCANISDRGLSSIASNCSKIYELDLYRCAGIGDDGIGALTNGCTRLKILNLSYCTKITDRGLVYIGQMEELLDLEMRALLNITSVGLTAVVAGCKRLSELDIKHCENVTDAGFWALAYHAQNLRQLNISNCSISDMGLCMVMSNLTRLQDVKLVDLSNITTEGFELALRACCRRIKKAVAHGMDDRVRNVAMQALLTQACTGVENQASCIDNLGTGLLETSPRNPSSVLSAALQASLNEARHAIDMMTTFSPLSVSYREQVAIEDCKELLDFSVSELALSLIEMKKIRAGTIYSEADLKAWLSAALGNQDTCLEGFQGTNRRVENFISGSLKQITQLISNVLTMYTKYYSLPFRPARNGTKIDPGLEFPEWMTEGDKSLLASRSSIVHVDAVVSLDGSGNYTSISQAILDAPDHSNRRYLIHVKKGVYKENIDLKKKKTNIMLLGDGVGATVVTGNRNFLQGYTTFRTATVAVSGKGFIARDMAFRNTAGPQNHQAVALRVDSDQSVFYRCSMEGYQDTLYAHSLRQFYRECNIYGTIDFIMGNGAAVLQNCKIFTRVPLPLQKVTITAQGRKSPHQSTGFSIQDSYIYATHPTYLGRPWKLFSRTVIMNTYMSSQVQPRGWLEWYGDFALNTLYYGEYKNYGPGSAVSQRVKWPGYHVIRDASIASFFTILASSKKWSKDKALLQSSWKTMFCDRCQWRVSFHGVLDMMDCVGVVVKAGEHCEVVEIGVFHGVFVERWWKCMKKLWQRG
ncbi:unnamed protein product [Rhodiola kirilowii]